MNPKLEENQSNPSPEKLGQRGELWVILQGLLLLGLILLPPVPLIQLNSNADLSLYGIWAMTFVFALTALIFIVKGLIDLGKNLTPLPYPKDDSTLVKTGIYGVVRHPLYSGLIFAALGWTIFQLSASHFLGTMILFIFLDLKARQEERWLKQKYPEYIEYCSQVKKLIPGIY
jgi:protein-S-isoprenylcysteine O-methyltransferase Ste14